MEGIWKKKVAGIPILYLALLFAAVLAFVAWRMKPSTPKSGDPATPDQSGDAAAAAAADYSNLATNGTVTVQQGRDPATITPVTVQTNERWIAQGANWAVVKGIATGSDAQDALRKYVAGEMITTGQKKIVDAVIAQYGVPPESITAGGQTPPPAPPPLRQGTPGLIHTVRGTSDNDFYKIDAIYYGQGQKGVDFLEYHNGKLPRGHGVLQVGDKVMVPVYAEKYYKPHQSMTAAAVAAKTGTTALVIGELNNVPATYTFAANTNIRVPS